MGEGITLATFMASAMDLMDGGWDFITDNPLIVGVLGVSVLCFAASKIKKLARR